MSVLPGIPKRIQSSSCCCFNVRTACLILGWLCVLSAVSNLFSINEATFKRYLPQESQEMASQLVYKAFFSNLLYGLCSGAMLVGVLKNKPKLMYPWIYLQFIGLVFVIILQIILPFIMLALFMTKDNQMSGSTAGLIFIGYVIFCVLADALAIYIIAPVITHCRQLLDMKRNQLTQSA